MWIMSTSDEIIRTGNLGAWLASVPADEREDFRLQADGPYATMARIGTTVIMAKPSQIGTWELHAHVYDNEGTAREAYRLNAERSRLTVAEAAIDSEWAVMRAMARAQGMSEDMVQALLPAPEGATR
jgi:hypothetical protein